MQLLIMLVIMLIMEILRPVPAPPQRPGLGDFTTPTAQQDRRVPVFWGKPWLVGPNLVDYGDLRIKKITKKIKGLFTSKKQTIGYKYFIGFHLIFGVGDENCRLRKIAVGGTNGAEGADIVWEGNLASGDGSIINEGLWGGEEERGGMNGTFTFMNGARNQGQNAYLKKMRGDKLPAYRGLCGLSWNQGYHGTQTVIEAWAAQIQRCPNNLGTVYSSINEEANGAEIQYELLTNSSFGMGLTSAEVDLPALRAVAKTVHDEGLGLSLIWDNAKSLEDMLKEVDRHLETLTYLDPNTGLWTMRAIREDYVIDDLPRVNKSNAKLLKFSRPTGDEMVNEVKVMFASAEFKGKTIPVQVQDLAAFMNRNHQRISVQQEYPGFTNVENANKVCSRDLRSMSYPFARVQLELDRSFYRLKPVDRIVFDWDFPDGPINNMPLLVLERDIGEMADGKITVTCVQDIFGVGEALYDEGSSSGWVPVDRGAKPPTAYRMEFSPYWILKQQDDVAGPLAAVPMLMVESPTEASLSYDLKYTDPSLNGAFATGDESQSFTPTATLVYDYLETTGQDTGGTLILNNLRSLVNIPTATVNDLRYLGSGLVVIDNEILGFNTAVGRSDGTWAITSVKRGLLDTVPARHLAGAKVWFIGEDVGRTPTNLLPFAAGTYRAKLITNAVGGTLLESAAPTVSITTNATDQNARPLYAYPPRNMTINGSVVPGKITGTSINIAWRDSNKEAESYIFFQDDAALSKPGDTSYRAYLYDDAGVLKAQSGALFSPGYTFAVGDVPGGLPQSGYVQVATLNAKGQSPRATLWFGRDVDYANTQDAGPQRLLEEAGPWTMIRMAD